MAVTSVRLRGQRTFTADEKGTLKGRKVYLVRCDDRSDGADIAANGVGVSVGGSYSDIYPGVLARSVEAEEQEQTATGVLYEVTIDYSSKSDNANGGDPDSNNPDPTQRPGILRLSWGSSDEEISKAIEVPTAIVSSGADLPIVGTWCWDTALCNSAGAPFENVRETQCDQVYTWEKNYSTLDWVTISDLLDEYVNTVNSTAFNITYRGVTKSFAAGTVRLWNPTSSPDYENGTQFERVTFELQVRKDGWRRKFLDKGSRAFLSTQTAAKGLAPTRTVDKLGDPTDRDVLLDGHGHILTADTAVFLVFKTKQEKDFNLLTF